LIRASLRRLLQDFEFSWGTLSALLVLLLAPLRASADSQQTYLQCLTNFESYAEAIWHTATYSNAPADAGYWGDGGSSGNGGVRGNGGVAVAYAVLVLAYPSDPKLTTRLARIRQALNFNAGAHISSNNVCTDGKQWGWSSASSTDWQTPEWTASMGLACLLVQNQLPAATVQSVQRVVASEATHRAAIAPASGYLGDTKAEENAWDSNVLALGAAWLSTNANATNWLTAAKKYLANAYTVASTNGDPLASWITTVTLFPSFALQNHGFYHPTYEMVAGMSLGDSLLMARLSNPSVAAELQPFAEHNVLNVWSNNLQCMVMGSGDFAYPAGLDWELHDYEQNSYITWMAVHFNNPLARWTDTQLAQLVRARQIVNGDGSFVGPSGGGFYREAVEARRTAFAWLQWAHADYFSGPSAAPEPVIAHFPDVQVIVQRNAAGYVSLSYGSRIMGMIEAPVPVGGTPTNLYVASPLLPGVIGLGALGNPTGARLIAFATNANGFDAELQITNGANGTTEAYVKSTGETVAIVEVPWPATSSGAGSVGSFDVGVENDPLTGGTRILEWTGGLAAITNRSGASRNISNNWVCVSGRYGLAAGPGGHFNYQAASSYNRLGAAQDTLQFLPDSPLTARYAVWFAGQSAAQTSSNASQITWSVAGTNALLTFPGLGGSPAQLAVVLPTAAPLYLPYTLPIAAVSGSSYQPSYPPTNAVDGNLNNFWVSSGTSAGQGPTTAHPEWLLVAFPRQIALSEFQIYPRTLNGGYGPRAVQLLLNVGNPASAYPNAPLGTNVYQGTMAATATLDVSVAQPVYATNALLWITSSYDPSYPTNSRNVQVVEMFFFERALPYTFGDWVVRQFTEAQIGAAAISGPFADPDGDGVPNLLEFAVGGNPLAPDASNAQLQPVAATPGSFAFRYRERKNLGDVQRNFERSAELLNWNSITPSSVTNLNDLGDSWVRQATFPATNAALFFRVRFQ
jgi:hypothetical protein